MYILSQILVCLAGICFACSMLSKTKIRLLIFLLSSDILFASHYLCLQAFSGSVAVFIDAIFFVVMFFIEKRESELGKIVCVIVTILAIIISCAITWSGPISLLPLFALLSSLIGMLFTHVPIVKTGAMFRNIFNIVYLILVESYFGAIIEFALLISTIAGIFISLYN